MLLRLRNPGSADSKRVTDVKTLSLSDEPDRRGITEMKYIKGLCRLRDDLLPACPGLRIANCSSGGRRLDFETASRSITLRRSSSGCFSGDKERRVTVRRQNPDAGTFRVSPIPHLR